MGKSYAITYELHPYLKQGKLRLTKTSRSKKAISKTVWTGFELVFYWYWTGFELVLNWFWTGFALILNQFWIGFELFDLDLSWLLNLLKLVISMVLKSNK